MRWARWPSRRRRVDRLLAAHASGGLDPAEARAVNDEVAGDPALRAELDEIAGTLAAVRAARPRPTEEPDWDAMAREIGRACDDSAPPATPRGLRRFWPARPAAALTLTAAGAAALAVAIAIAGRLDREPDPPRPQSAQATAPAPRAGEVAAAEAVVDPAAEPAERDDDDDDEGEDALPDLGPGLDALSGDELAAFERALDREGAAEDAFVADLLAGPAETGTRSAVEALRDGGDDGDDDEPAIDPFRPPDALSIDDLADELPDEALDAIDRFLAEVQAG
jgi:hypothetical protein